MVVYKMANWKTLEGKHIESIYDVVRETCELAIKNNGHVFAYVGTDSQNLGMKFTSFVQCVALHIFDDTGSGKGGRVFYVKHMETRYKQMNKRLLREVEISIKLAQKLEPMFNDLNVEFEIHADVNSFAGFNNENKSNEVHDTVKGWVEGVGMVCKTKPLACISSIVADKVVR